VAHKGGGHISINQLLGVKFFLFCGLKFVRLVSDGDRSVNVPGFSRLVDSRSERFSLPAKIACDVARLALA